MPTLKINEQEVTVAAGATVLAAAQQAGADVPVFCYHPGLSVPANCRMCLVEIGMGKGTRVMPACYTQAADGMEVDTRSTKTDEARKSVLEFILLNHPVDCPICDQAGECDLQDNYFEYSAQPSRLRFKKVHKPKVKMLGPQIVLDAERCILCTRCVRFCEEVTGTAELQVSHRGEHSEITTFPGVELDNAYSLCTADICPVGALTSRDFRFRARVWNTERAAGVCDGCARGCSVWVDSLRGEVKRLMPRENPDVNGWWACDEGRLAFRALAEERVTAARLEGADATSPGAVYEAIGRRIAEITAGADEAPSAPNVGILVHPSWSCEDLFAVASLVKALGGAPRVYVGGRDARGSQDDILIRADKNANRRGMERIFKALGIVGRSPDYLRHELGRGDLALVLVCGGDHHLDGAIVEAVQQASHVAVLTDRATPLAEGAWAVAPVRSVFERSGTFVNFKDRIQRFHKATDGPRGVAAPWRAVSRVAAAAGHDLGFDGLAGVYGAMAESVTAFRDIAMDDVGEHGTQARLA